ncbi:MAG: hypothetical protein ING69_10545 [Rhodocyclaceae bacterium]|nr:hypothetical protein [Rhodocyclaceae bacterium]
MAEIDKITQAMPATRYEIAIKTRDRVEHRSYTAADLEKNRDFLEKRVAEKAELRVRPADNSFVALRKISDENAQRLKEGGFEPAWRSRDELAIKVGPLPREKHQVLTEHLAKQYGAEPADFKLPPKFDEIRTEPPTRQAELRDRAHGLSNIPDRNLDFEKAKALPAYKVGMRDGARDDFAAERTEERFDRLVETTLETTPTVRRPQVADELEEIAREAKLAERYYKARVAEEVKKLRQRDEQRDKERAAGWREESLEQKRQKRHSRTLMAWEKPSATMELKPPMSAEEQEAVRAIVANTMSHAEEPEPEKAEKPAQKEQVQEASKTMAVVEEPVAAQKEQSQEISHSYEFEFTREHKS